MNRKIACLFLFFIAAFSSVSAETVYFGGSLIGDTINSGNSWNTASNWLLEDKSEYGKVPQEGDKILAKFNDGTPAIIERGKNIFCAIPTMPSELMRYAAKRAGAHVYTDAPAAVYANGKYVSICATADGPYEIDLGDTYKIREVFDGQDLGVSRKINFEMKKGDIKFLRLDPPSE